MESLFVAYRIWYRHEVPYPVCMTGRWLVSAVRVGKDLTPDIMTAYVRLLQSQDRTAYEQHGCVAMKWRHYMEPLFAVCNCFDTILWCGNDFCH
jgi:hypothetical protein